jgi:hypothetical protein
VVSLRVFWFLFFLLFVVVGFFCVCGFFGVVVFVVFCVLGLVWVVFGCCCWWVAASGALGCDWFCAVLHLVFWGQSWILENV